jgi:formylglycine-generating enzyme required for sulfatase activity
MIIIFLLSILCVFCNEAPKKEIQNSIGMKFILLPKGSFIMSENKFFSIPIHEVIISKAFYIQNTEVTQGQWKKVMKINPSEFIGCGDDCPVENISWNEANDFIKKLNEMENTNKYRLPSNAEWEYACRAGTSTEYSFGDDIDKLGVYAWYDGNSQDSTHPVGTKKANGWGLYDMHGNVWEWVEDDYDFGYYNKAPKDGRAWVDDPRANHSLIRGCGWRSESFPPLFEFKWRSSDFFFNKKKERLSYLGFRICKDVEDVK